MKKMRSVIFFSLLTVVYTVFAATVYKMPHEECPKGQKQVCVPNCTFKDDCNTCTCNACGTAAGCTKLACPPKQVCVPNMEFKQQCNTCICNEFGTGATCTLMACNVMPNTHAT